MKNTELNEVYENYMLQCIQIAKVNDKSCVAAKQCDDGDVGCKNCPFTIKEIK